METINNFFDNMTLCQIKADAKEAVSNWNGEDERGEDRASVGEDILEAVRNLEELLDQFNSVN